MSNVISLEKCRVCDNRNLDLVFDAGTQALTGRFPKSTDESITSGPLELVRCNPDTGCGLVQLGHSYDLEEMYGESYGYRSGLNKSMVLHLESKVASIMETANLQPDDLVIDIGSNDGTTLNSYPSGQYNLVGVDPAASKFGQYYKEEITRVTEFFNEASITKYFADKKAKVVTSFSMFYDLEDPVQFATDIASVLADDGIWVFEQSYLLSMLTANSFDTICHEHLEYYTLDSVSNILDRAGLQVCDVEFNDVNGGSFSVTACKKDTVRDINHQKLDSILKQEIDFGVNDGSAFNQFAQRIEDEKNKLMSFLAEQKAQGNQVSALGASTKGNVLLQYYGIDTDLINVVGEVNPDKFGCFTPGTHIPIVDQVELLADKPDYMLVLPWHFESFFVNSQALKGHTLVFPLPQFKVVKL